MRKLRIGTGIIAFLVMMFGAFWLTQRDVPSAAAQDSQTTMVQRVALTTTVETSGTIAAERTASLTFDTSGTVREILADVGDEVTTGQELARLDTADLEYQVALKEQALIVQQKSYDSLTAEPTAEEIAQAEANLASAQSQLQSAQSALDTAPSQTTLNCSDLETRRIQLEDTQDDYNEYVENGYEWDATFMPDPDSEAGTALRDAQTAYDLEEAQCSTTTSDSEYELQLSAAQSSVDQAQAALDSLMNGADADDIATAEAQLEQARLELENANAQLADAVLVAPFAGVISENNLVLGVLTSSNTTAMTLIDHHQLHVDVDIDELDIAQINVGQEAIISPDALDGASTEGTISRIAPIGTTTDGIVTYDVRVDLVEIESLPVRIGMTVEVTITVASEGEVLAVPTEAIQREGTTEFVEVVTEGSENRRVSVTTGQTSDGMTEITGSVNEGDVVVTPPQETIASGANNPFGGQP